MAHAFKSATSAQDATNDENESEAPVWARDNFFGINWGNYTWTHSNDDDTVFYARTRIGNDMGLIHYITLYLEEDGIYFTRDRGTEVSAITTSGEGQSGMRQQLSEASRKRLRKAAWKQLAKNRELRFQNTAERLIDALDAY